MPLYLQQIVAIARTEWLQLWRSLGMRLMLALIALSFVSTLTSPHHIPLWQDDSGVSTLTFTSAFVALLGAFLVVPTRRREQMLRVSPLIWVRPLNGDTYLIGKIVGGALGMGVLLGELTVLVAIVQITGGGTLAPAAVVGVVLAIALSLLLATVIYVGSAVLFSHPVVGYLAALVGCSLFGLFLTQSMAVLWNPWVHAMSYNRVIGFGPDLWLLLTNRLFYLGILLLVAAGVVVLFKQRENRALVGRRHRTLAACLLIGGVAGSATGLVAFQQAASAVLPSGPIAPPAAAPVTIQGYSLRVRLDPRTAMVQGTAEFSMHSTSNTPLTHVALYLNDGLRVTSASLDDKPVQVEGAALFATLRLSPAFSPGARAHVRITYQGRYKLLRVQYGSDRPGYIGRVAFLSAAPLHQTVIGLGMAMLFRDGDWYPLPWVQAIMNHSPAPLDWRTLQIAVAGHRPLIASTSHIQADSGGSVATWRLSGHLPTAILAAVPDTYRKVSVPGGTIYAPADDVATITGQYAPYVLALQDLMRYFSRPSDHVSVVITPLALGAGSVTVHAAVGDGVAFVPMNSLDQTPEGATVTISQLEEPAPYRAALDDLAVAWWAGRLPGVGVPTPALYDPGIDLPTGYIGVTEISYRGGSDRTTMLAGYTGAAIAARRVGMRFYHDEMLLRRQAARYTMQTTLSDHMVQLQLGQGPLAAAMQLFGLSGRLAPQDTTPALDDLQHAIGPDHLHRTLVAMAEAAQVADDSNSVACALTRMTGHDVAALMNRYLYLMPRYHWALAIKGCS